MTLTRNRKVAPTIPYAFIHGVDGAAIGAVPAALEWERPHYINSSIGFTNNTTKIRINRGSEGLFEVDASVGVLKKTGNPTECIIGLHVNGVAIPCCLAHGSIGAGTEHADAFLHTSVYLNVGDYVEIYASVDAGTGTVEAHTARFHIKGITLVGWDNKRGGSQKYPFRQE